MYVLALFACASVEPPGWLTAERGESNSFVMGGPADDGGDGSGDGIDDQSDDPCFDDGECELAVSSVGYTPGGSDTGRDLVVSVLGAGTVQVFEDNAATGCCPDVTVTAAADRDGVIRTAIELGGDDCACSNVLDFSYVISEIPPGTWRVVAGNQGVEVAVP